MVRVIKVLPTTKLYLTSYISVYPDGSSMSPWKSSPLSLGPAIGSPIIQRFLSLPRQMKWYHAPENSIRNGLAMTVNEQHQVEIVLNRSGLTPILRTQRVRTVKSFIMCPHSNNLYCLATFKNLIYKPMLNVYAARIGTF